MLSSSRMLDRLLLLSLLSLTLTGHVQASMRGSLVGPHRIQGKAAFTSQGSIHRYMPGKWSGIMPRNIPLQRSIIGNMLGNLMGNILRAMPRNSLPGMLLWKTQKSITGGVPEGGDSMGKLWETRRGSLTLTFIWPLNRPGKSGKQGKRCLHNFFWIWRNLAINTHQNKGGNFLFPKNVCPSRPLPSITRLFQLP